MKNYFVDFTDTHINDLSITFEKILVFNKDPNKILILANNKYDEGKLSIHLLDFNQLFTNGKITCDIKFLMNLDYKDITKLNNYYFTLYNEKLIVIDRK